jgi:transcription initiation factor IIE alpha subunit
MTSEIVQFKCPSCGQKLTEEEYWHVCQIQKSQIDQMLAKELERKTSQIEQKYVLEINQ